MTKPISGGVAHDLPADLRKVLSSDPKALAAWEDLTPLARNGGFVGLFPSKNQRRDENTLNVYARSLKKGYAALVVGWVVLIERISH
jgi:type II secretory pathway component PulC